MKKEEKKGEWKGKDIDCSENKRGKEEERNRKRNRKRKRRRIEGM